MIFGFNYEEKIGFWEQFFLTPTKPVLIPTKRKHRFKEFQKRRTLVVSRNRADASGLPDEHETRVLAKKIKHGKAAGDVRLGFLAFFLDNSHPRVSKVTKRARQVE